MRHREWNRTAADGVSLFTQAWEPAGEATAAICLVHGFGEHSGRYQPVARALVSRGWAVAADDLRGHGRSEGKRGHIPSYSCLLDDLSDLVATVQERFPQRPLILYGHSMGGNLVLNHMLRRHTGAAAVVATSPWLRRAGEFSKFVNFLIKLWSLVTPGLAVPAHTDLDILSRDPERVAAVRNDPLCYDVITPRLYRSMYTSGLWAIRHAAEFNRPLLLMHGTRDKHISYKGTQEFALRVPAGCCLKLWEGGYHELHNDIIRDEVINYMMDWIGKTIQTEGASPSAPKR